MDALLPLLGAALALMGSPGPATLSVAAAGAAFGPRRALPYAAGITLGTSTVILIVASGLTTVVLALPGAAPVVTVLAAAYILWLAWKIAAAPPLGAATRAETAPQLWAGLALGIANPKAYAAIASIFASAELAPGDPVSDALVKVALLVPLAVAINGIWLLAGTGIAQSLRSPRASRRLNLAFALALVVSVAAALAP